MEKTLKVTWMGACSFAQEIWKALGACAMELKSSPFPQ